MPSVDKEVFKLVLDQLNRKYPDYESKRRLIEEAFYWESRRLLAKSKKTKAESKFYNDLKKKYVIDETQVNNTFRAIIKNHLKEIQGKFSYRLFLLTRRILTSGLKYFINDFHPIDYLRNRQTLTSPKKKIHVTGSIKKAINISQKHTLVVVPNHVSNFDSVVLGYGLNIAGIPPFFYGAGLNLFTNPFLSFFMHNLGAYKVDREKRHLLYKEILKAYSIAMLQMGKHSLFFPGGTRLRSGGVEKNLKMGLLGTAIAAYSLNLQLNREKKFIFLPVTLNYQVVMEAQSMIKDYLRSTGKEKYMGDPPDLKSGKNIFKKFSNILRLDTDIFIHLGEPMDILGNPVDINGNSVTEDGSKIDLVKYFSWDGKVRVDEDRDRVFTSFLAKKIEKSYEKYNIITRGNVVAFAIIKILQAKYGEKDIFKLLYLSKEKRVILKGDLLKYLTIMKKIIQNKETEGNIQTEPGLFSGDIEQCMETLDKKFKLFYYPKPLSTVGYQIIIYNMPLIIYYYNRIGLVFGGEFPEAQITNGPGKGKTDE